MCLQTIFHIWIMSYFHYPGNRHWNVQQMLMISSLLRTFLWFYFTGKNVILSSCYFGLIVVSCFMLSRITALALVYIRLTLYDYKCWPLSTGSHTVVLVAICIVEYLTIARWVWHYLMMSMCNILMLWWTCFMMCYLFCCNCLQLWDFDPKIRSFANWNAVVKIQPKLFKIL